MKLGVICEGEMTDGPVLRTLLEAEFPNVEFEVEATTKAAIFSAVGIRVDRLLAKGFERIVIVWDLYPLGTQMSVNSQTEHEVRCQWDQRKTLLAVAEKTANACLPDIRSLQVHYGFRGEGIVSGNERVALVCFSESFDAVFLTDVDFLRKLASSNIRDAEQPPAVRDPASAKRPAELIRRYFRRGHNKRLKYFNKYEHNILLAQEFVREGRLGKLRAHPGYERLVVLIAKWVSMR